MAFHKFGSICALFFVLAFNVWAYAQLPKRPAPGESEESVTPEIAQKVDEYFEKYEANYKTISRFVGIATLERTMKRKGEPLELELMYFVHSQDFKRHVRRIDTVQPMIANLRDGTQKPSFFKLVTIESEKGAWQYQSTRTAVDANRESFEKGEEFERKFRPQVRLDFWETPLIGSMPVLHRNGQPKLAMRDLPKVPAFFQEGGRITAYEDDLKKVVARVNSDDSGMAWDITFSKDLGGMPTRVVVSRNDMSWQGIQCIIDTQWSVYRSNQYKQPVYLPTQVNVEYTLQRGTMRDTHEFFIDWLVGNEVEDVVFSQERDFFLQTIDVQEMVRSKRLELDRRKVK